MENKMLGNRMVVGGAFSSYLKSPLFKKKNLKAFTLAEVLVTLTIIGVVSAMTIPTLHQRHNEQVTVKKVQKFFSTMSQAHQKAVSEYGDIETWGITGPNPESALLIYDYMFKDNFKIMVNCGLNNTKKCLTDGDFFHLNGANLGNFYSQNYYYKMILNDGATIWFRGATKAMDNIFIDVNGPKKPNTWGKDIFSLLYSPEDGVFVPDGTPNSSNPFDTSCKKTSNGFGCGAWVFYKGNMDYLHCDDLKWSGKQKCSKK